MKNKLIIILTFILAIGLLLSCKKGPGADTGVIELSYSIFFPPTHGQCKAGMDWAKEIEKRTNGAVKINVYPGGTLTKADECYDGVVKGISDLGMSCFAYTRGRFPIMEAVDLPMGYPDGTTATKTAHNFYKIMKPKELNDVKVLYIHAHGPGILHTKKAVRKLDDIKGLKIRSTGLSSKVVKALGGVPVAMPQGETYEALQKGVVDGTFTPIETLKGWRQAEVVKYTTECKGIGYTTAMFVVINKDKWDSLPENIQKIFTETSEEWVTVHGKTWDEVDIEGKNYAKSLKNEIITLSNQENVRWINAVQPIINEYIQEKKAMGLDGAKAIVELKKLIDQ